MKRKATFGLVAVTFVLTGCSHALYNKGDKAFEALAFEEATEHYTRALERKATVEGAVRLADAQRSLGNWGGVEAALQRAIMLDSSDAHVALQLAEARLVNGRLTEAHTAAQIALPKRRAEAYALLARIDSAMHRAPSLYVTEQIDLPGVTTAFSPVAQGDGFLFAGEPSEGGEVNPWNGRAFLDLFEATSTDEVAYRVKPVGGNVNGAWHDGPIAVHPDGEYALVTRSDQRRKGTKLELSEDAVSELKLVVARREAGGWVVQGEAAINREGVSMGQPAFAASGREVIFVADLPGGRGETDLYRAAWRDGRLGEPRPLPASLNTKGREMFPTFFTDPDGVEWLYFASDGRDGYGGLDLYRVARESDGWGRVQHLPAPLSSGRDDFGVAPTDAGTTGFLSSNRDGDGSRDHIYRFHRRNPQIVVIGSVQHAETGIALDSVYLDLTGGSLPQFAVVDAQGRFEFRVESDYDFELAAKRSRFMAGRTAFSTVGIRRDDTIRIELALEPIVIDKPIVLENIYYDYDRWEIRADAAEGLDVLVDVLRDNPEISVELSSHTDARGSDGYNLDLSQKRAESAVAYILGLGIAPDRITARGYGESRLVNDCRNGIDCDDTQHESNRRTEFAVTGVSRDQRP